MPCNFHDFEIRRKVPTGTQTPGHRMLSSVVCLEWLLKLQLIHKASVKTSSKLCCPLLLPSFLGSMLVLLSMKNRCAATSCLLNLSL